MNLEKLYEDAIMTCCKNALAKYLGKAPETIKAMDEQMDKAAAHWQELESMTDGAKENPPKNLFEAYMNVVKFNATRDRLQASWEI